MIEVNVKTSVPRKLASRASRAGLRSLVESGSFQQFIIAVMVVNAVLNLFIAIIVNSMQEVSVDDKEAEAHATSELRDEVSALRRELAAWRKEVRIAPGVSQETTP